MVPCHDRNNRDNRGWTGPRDLIVIVPTLLGIDLLVDGHDVLRVGIGRVARLKGGVVVEVVWQPLFAFLSTFHSMLYKKETGMDLAGPIAQAEVE